MPYHVEVEFEVGWECKQNVGEFRVYGSNGVAVVHLNQHDAYTILLGKDETHVCVDAEVTPLEGQLVDFLNFGSKTTCAASTGSILRTIRCIEQARFQLASLGVKTARELKR